MIKGHIHEGKLQIDRERGVLYFFDEAGACLLRVEGVKGVPADHQIDIHLVEPGGAHHHENCGNRSLLSKVLPRDPGVFCAVKLEEKGEKNPC